TLARAIEAQTIVASSQPGSHYREVRFFDGAVIAAGNDQRLAWRTRVIYPVEVTGHRGIFVGDLDKFNRQREKRCRLAESLRLPVECLYQPGIDRCAKQHDRGSAKVIRAAQVPLASTDAMPCRPACLCLCVDPLSSPVPFCVPAFEVAIGDVPGCGHALADISASVVDVAERSQQLPIKKGIVKKYLHLFLSLQCVGVLRVEFNAL